MTGGSSPDLRLRRRQAWAVARSEILPSLFGRRALPALLLVGMPLALMVLRALFMPEVARANVSHATTEFAEVFNLFILRFIVFFTNAVIFVRLFRGEMLDKSLHYTLLAPLRRDVLVVGKYAGGLVAAAVVLVPATALTYLLAYLPHGAAGLARLSSAAGVQELALYLLMVVLACIAYGALFLLAGLYFKNPMVPAVLFLGWEILTPFLPTFLKYVSFVHYLVSFAPVPVTLGAFALLAEPVPRWIALLALPAASTALVFVATRAARRLEVAYSAD